MGALGGRGVLVAELGHGRRGRGSSLMTAGPWNLAQGLRPRSEKVHERVGGRNVNLGAGERTPFRCGAGETGGVGGPWDSPGESRRRLGGWSSGQTLPSRQRAAAACPARTRAGLGLDGALPQGCGEAVRARFAVGGGGLPLVGSWGLSASERVAGVRSARPQPCRPTERSRV